MRRLLAFVCVVVAVGLCSTLNRPAPFVCRVEVTGGLGILTGCLQTRGEHITLHRGVMRLDVVDRDATLSNLADLYWAEQTAINVARGNIANARTRYAIGEPYLRQVPVLDSRGRVTVGEQTDGIKWVYDPASPLADKTGKNKGYVACSNVNVREEQTDIAYHQRAQRLLLQVMQRIDPNVILGEPGPWVPQQPLLPGWLRTPRHGLHEL